MIEPFFQVGMHYMKGRGPAISVPAFHRLRWRRDNRASVSVAATASWPIDTSSARLSTNINSAARNGRTGSGQVRRPAAWESISITRRERERERALRLDGGRQAPAESGGDIPLLSSTAGSAGSAVRPSD